MGKIDAPTKILSGLPMTFDHAKVSIIIVSFNTQAYLERCLATLETCHFTFDYEVVIIDNGSSDGSVRWLQGQSFSNNYKVILSESNLGFAKANNLGIKQATGDFILLLNTDAFPHPESLENQLRFMLRHPRVAITGPQLVYENGRWQRSTGLFLSKWVAFLTVFGVISFAQMINAIIWYLMGRKRPPYKVKYVDGAAMMLRRTALDEIGLLDESFFFYVEDMELCYRARKNGWEIYFVPQSVVTHIRGGSSTSTNLERSLKMHIESKRIFMLRHYGPKEWKSYCRIMAFNSRWRFWLCRYIVRRCLRVCDRYRLSALVYEGASNASGNA